MEQERGIAGASDDDELNFVVDSAVECRASASRDGGDRRDSNGPVTFRGT